MKRLAFAAVAALLLAGGAAASARSPQLVRPPAKPFLVAQNAKQPWIAVADNGTAHIAWTESASSGDSTHYCSIARGKTACSHAQSFRPTGGGSYDFPGPHTVLTDQDDVVLETNRCCVANTTTYAYVSTNGGASFGPQQRIGSVGPDGDAEFGPGAFSITNVTDTETAGLFAQVVPIDGGSPVSEKARLNSDVHPTGSLDAIYDGSVAMLNPTTPMVAFSDRSKIYYRRWSGSGDVNNAATWLPSKTFGAGSFPRLTGGPKGIFMIYTTGPSGSGNYAVARYDPASGRFTSPTTLDTHAGAWVRRQDIWEDRAGNVHVAWRRSDSTGYHLEYSVSRDGRTWSKPRALIPPASASVGMDDIHVRTGHDGGGFVLWQKGDKSIWAVPLPRLATVGGGTCPTELRFGVTIALAKEGCFKRVGAVYTISAPIRINGLDIGAPGTFSASSPDTNLAMPKLTIEPSTGSLTTAGRVLVSAGQLDLGRQTLDWRIPAGGGDLHDAAGNPAALQTGALHERLMGLPVSGYITPRFRRGAADLPINLTLPSPVSGAVGGGETSNITIQTDQSSSGGLLIGKGHFHLHIDDAFLGIAELKPIDINYTSDPEVLSGEVGILLPVVQSKLDSTFLFRQGEFIDATARLQFPDPGLPVSGTVYLNAINFHAHKLTSCSQPTSIGGGVEFSGGPKLVGVALVRIDGDVTYAFPESTCGLPGVLTVSGRGYVLDFPVAEVHAVFKTSGYFGFGAHIDVGSPSTVDVRAGVDGAVDIPSKQFYASGDASVTAIGYSLVHTTVLVSNIGIGACVTLVPAVDAGFEYKWGEHLVLMFPSCDVDDLKPGIMALRLSSAGLQAVGSFTVPAGAPSFGVAAFGPGSPRVTVTDPQGHSFTTPAPGKLTDSQASYRTARLPGLNETTVTLVKPAAGRWTVSAAPGSTVQRVLNGVGRPKPQVRAHVARLGGRNERLVYHVRQIPGQQVRFVEEAGSVSRALGAARNASGKIRFSAADGPGGKRDILALVSQDGFPRARLVVAHYTAPPPLKPSRPRVRAHRAGKTVRIRWTRSRGAARYVVRALMRDGRRTQWILPGLRHSLRIPRVPGIDGGRFLVAGLTADGRAGRPGSARVPPHPKKKKKRRHR